MLLKNRKGFSLIELLIVIAILGVVSPLIFIIFASGIEDFSTTSKYLDEQYTVMEVTRHIRQDVEACKTIIFYKDASGIISKDKIEFVFPETGSQKRTWEFVPQMYSDGKPYKQLCLRIGTGTSDVIVDDLDPESMFSFSPSGDVKDATRLILVIKPTQLNKKYPGRNVDENINTEFSVRYKIKDVT